MGLIESRGHLPLVSAVDGALKAAQVTLESRHRVGGGLSAATVRGDVGSVRAALEAALAIIETLGAKGVTHLIPRPDPAVWAMLEKDGLCLSRPPESSPPAGPEAACPVLKKEADVPAVRAEAEPPALRPEAGSLKIQAQESPAAALENGPQKTAAKPKKPRKPGKK